MELLAPAGSYKALVAAIYAGANAVYLGMDKFNARAKADNFTKDNIKDVVSLCHLHNVKVYVTFNTLIKDSEFDSFEEEVRAAVDANVDAFLVTDLGTLSVFRKYNIPLHASTQMGIHNVEGAIIAKELGFTRVVLSREALKEDVKKIKALGLEVEYFVHGALCVAFSGSCLLSSFMSGDSGNRGLCKQPCRLCYHSTLSDKDKYYLSPSDQCFIDEIDELESWGVDSLKIEGRLKAPHYVGSVVKEYRDALDGRKNINYIDNLKRAYNRGSFTKGYNFDQTKDIMSIDVQGNIGKLVGTIKDCVNKTLIIDLEDKLALGDGVKIIYNGAEVGGFLIDNIEYAENLAKVKTINVYPKGAKVYVTLDNSQVKQYENIDLRLPVKFEFLANEGKSFYLKAISNGVELEKNYDEVQVAQKAPVSKETIIEKLSEVNEMGFRVEHIDGSVSSNAFIPMSKLKQIKREILNELKEKIINEYNMSKRLNGIPNIKINLPKNELKNTLFEIDKDVDFDIDLENVDLVVKINDYKQSNIKNWLIYNKIDKYLLKMPKILRSNDMDAFKNCIKNDPKIKGLVVENIAGIQICKEYDLACVFGAGMSILNSRYKDIFDVPFVQSQELSYKENLKGAYIYSYGYIELMHLTHCPVQLNTGCTCKDCKYNGDFAYINRNNEYKVVRNRVKHCYFALLSPKVLDLSSLNYKKVYISSSYIENFDNKVLSKDADTSDSAYLGHTYLPIK